MKELRPVRSVLSSPALSIDRIEIIYGNHDSVMISPVDRDRFMAELELLRKQAR
ncbi:MAG: PH domain-containing protein [Steroidobacteraceae bacterium]